jgi:hypothetical protein
VTIKPQVQPYSLRWSQGLNVKERQSRNLFLEELFEPTEPSIFPGALALRESHSLFIQISRKWIYRIIFPIFKTSDQAPAGNEEGRKGLSSPEQWLKKERRFLG